MRIHFILLCEGSSDEALIPHLRSLLVDCGAKEATGAAPNFDRLPKYVSKDIESKVRAVLWLEEHMDLLFIHRDADSPDPEPRYNEIFQGVGKAGYTTYWIGVVPVQEIEAWLLLNESAIRHVSGRPKGKVALNLPNPNRVEELSNPKERLLEEILRSSKATGRRYTRLRRKFPVLRAQLLSGLKIGGPLLNVTSWVRLRTDIENYIKKRETNDCDSIAL